MTGAEFMADVASMWGSLSDMMLTLVALLIVLRVTGWVIAQFRGVVR